MKRLAIILFPLLLIIMVRCGTGLTNVPLGTGSGTGTGGDNGGGSGFPPQVTSLEPNSGTRGTTVKVNGKYFVSGTVIQIGNVPCTSQTFVSSVEISCVTPALQPGQNDIFATNPDDQSFRLVAGYTSRAFLYATYTSAAVGLVAAFEIGADGLLTEVTGSPFGPNAEGRGLAFSPNFRTLYVLDRTNAQVLAFGTQTDGSLVALTSGGSLALSAADPDRLLIDGTGRFGYVLYPTTEVVRGFTVNESTGALVGHILGQGTYIGGTPKGMVLSAEGRRIYVALASGGAYVGALNIALANGNLSPVPNQPFGNNTNDWVVSSPINQRIYGLGTTIMEYSITSSTGELLPPLNPYIDLGQSLTSGDVTPDGKYLFGISTASQIRAYAIGGDGNFTPVIGPLINVATPSYFAMAPWGKHLFIEAHTFAAPEFRSYAIATNGTLSLPVPAHAAPSDVSTIVIW